MRFHVRLLDVAVAGALLACASLSLGGCGGSGSTPASRDELVLAAVAAAGRLPAPPPEKSVVTPSDPVVEGDYKKIYEQHDAIRNLESVTNLGTNDDVVWVGALLKGTHLGQFVYEPISVPRGPMTISLSLEGTGTTGLSATVESPSTSSVRTAISSLVASHLASGTAVPARVDYREEQVSDASSLSLALGADASYGGANISTQFDFNSTTKQTKLLVRYTQIYYTVDVNGPISPLELFSPQATAADVSAAMPPGSMPVYVASVGYGMTAVMCIETDFTAEEMSAALDFAYQGTFDAEVRFGYTAAKVLEKSNITIIVYGGSTKGLADIEYGYEGFQRVIQASQQYDATTPALPIFYKFRHLADSTLAQISLTSQYTLVRPVQIRQSIVVRTDRFVCEMSDDEGVANDVDINNMTAWTTGYQGTPLAAVPPGEQLIYQYAGAAITMPAGTIHTAGQEQVVTFDTETYDLADARLNLRAFVNDYDSASADESGETTLQLSGRQFFENGGVHYVYVYSTDFRFRVDFTLMDGTLP